MRTNSIDNKIIIIIMKAYYRIAGNIDEDFNLMLWRFKHQIAKNKTVRFN